MHVVGIDCATQPEKTGMVLASWNEGRLRIEDSALGSKKSQPVDVITDWYGQHPSVLLALDAPLGWPRRLGQSLVQHRAGDLLPGERNELFRRATDDFIKELLGKRPLDVGADRIARTAHAALELLDGIRQRTGMPVPLVWEPSSFDSIAAIEVYPAATRIAVGATALSPLDDLSTLLEGELANLDDSPHVHDAAWCAVAGSDFLAGNAEAPRDLELAEYEGWIWVRSPTR